MAGPPPKPTHLKLITGNPGRRPLNKKEPRPAAGVPTVPAHLSAEAKAEWRRISATLGKLGLLTGVDRSALAAYCQAYADWIEAEDHVRDEGKVTLTPVVTETREFKNGTKVTKESGGYPIQNPWLAIRNRALDTMRQFLTEFGMTPASRSKISIEGDGGDQPKDPAAAYF